MGLGDCEKSHVGKESFRPPLASFDAVFQAREFGEALRLIKKCLNGLSRHSKKAMAMRSDIMTR